ncbi:MAG: hypothetical protein KF706_08625 [Chitinophagales bacterium]|nr:hypothetical protein [Chitinophagales bacterium]
MSKILFESKSQHAHAAVPRLLSCCSICQRYFLKANHNTERSEVMHCCVVVQYVKDTPDSYRDESKSQQSAIVEIKFRDGAWSAVSIS